MTLKHLLLGKRSAFTPARALDLLSQLHSADIVLPTTDGHEIRLRDASPSQQLSSNLC